MEASGLISERSAAVIAKVRIKTASKKVESRLRFYNDEFVFDVVSGSFYRVSPVAVQILRGIIEGEDIDSLVSMVEGRYGIDRMTALRDIELFYNSLFAEGLKESSLSRKS